MTTQLTAVQAADSYRKILLDAVTVFLMMESARCSTIVTILSYTAFETLPTQGVPVIFLFRLAQQPAISVLSMTEEKILTSLTALCWDCPIPCHSEIYQEDGRYSDSILNAMYSIMYQHM